MDVYLSQCANLYCWRNQNIVNSRVMKRLCKCGWFWIIHLSSPTRTYCSVKLLVPLNRRPSETWRKNPFLLYRRTLLVCVRKLRIFCKSIARFCCTRTATGGVLELALLEASFNGRATDKLIHSHAMVTQVTSGVLKDRQKIIITC